MEKEIICTICPIGCNIRVRGEGDQIVSVEGNKCKRGIPFAKAEFSNPLRILTSLVKTDDKNQPLVPVRSSKPIAKALIFPSMEKIKKKQVSTPIKRNDIIIKNIDGAGTDIISTANIG